MAQIRVTGRSESSLCLCAFGPLRPNGFPNRAPQAVSNTLWALGRMGAYHEPAVTAGLAAFRAAHEAYKPVEVSNLLWALTSFRHHPEGAFAQLINWWVRTGSRS